MIFTDRIKAIVAFKAAKDAEIAEAEKKAETARLEADRLRQNHDDAWPQVEQKAADAEMLAERLEKETAEAVKNFDPYLAKEIIDWVMRSEKFSDPEPENPAFTPEKALALSEALIELAREEEKDVSTYLTLLSLSFGLGAETNW